VVVLLTADVDKEENAVTVSKSVVDDECIHNGNVNNNGRPVVIIIALVDDTTQPMSSNSRIRQHADGFCFFNTDLSFLLLLLLLLLRTNHIPCCIVRLYQ
jgi:hypothetical protein